MDSSISESDSRIVNIRLSTDIRQPVRRNSPTTLGPADNAGICLFRCISLSLSLKHSKAGDDLSVVVVVVVYVIVDVVVVFVVVVVVFW